MFATCRPRSLPLAIAIGFPLVITTTAATALGFGRVVNTTQLGQPLDFAAAVQLGPDETLTRECVDAEVVSGETRLQRGQLRVTLEPGADAATRSLRVTSVAPIDEPVVTVHVTLGCTDKVSRNFVAFVDPPAFDTARFAAADAARLPPQRIEPPAAPLPVLAPPDADVAVGTPPPPAAAASAASGSVSGTVGGAVAGAPADREAPAAVRTPPRRRRDAVVPVPVAEARVADAAPQPRRPAAPRVAAASPANRGAKLQLDPAPSAAGGSRVAAAGAAPAASSVATPAPAAAPVAAPALPLVAVAVPAGGIASAASAALATSPAADVLGLERRRVQQLEDGLARVTADARETRRMLNRLQARLDAAEAQRYANPLVYGLAAFCGLAVVAIAGLVWRRGRVRAGRPWWQPPDGASRAPTVTMAALPPDRFADADVGAPAAPAAEAAEAQSEFGVRPAAVAAPAVVEGGARAAAPWPPAPTTAPDMLLRAAPPAELAVEELIDLEQQADFFVVLGQEDAAIDLLTSHMRSYGGISPLPYLKLLEIHRRRDDRDAYERVRGRFNRRFNAQAPAWDLDLELGRELADHPDVAQRLQAVWARPASAMKALDALLFRRGGATDTFDLPAYRELLLLYSVARDLAEQAAAPDADEADAVDLLLPLDAPLDLDVSLPATSVEELDTRAALLEFGEAAVRVRELARAG